MVTMKDIAEKAGVSQATVSRVLSSSPSVTPETKALVMEWVRKMDFQPNLSARALASKRSHLIGLILPDIQNPYFSNIIYHVDKIALSNGFNIILSNSNGDADREREIIKSMKSRQVEGILVGFTDPKSPGVEFVRNMDLPVVVITQIHEGLDCVGTNHFAGGELAARHLIERGADHFVYQGNPDDDKYRGFLKGLIDSGVKESQLDVIDLGNVWYHCQLRAYNSALDYIKQNSRAGKTGVFSYNDLSAFGFIHASQDMKKKVPEEYSILGFDDTFMCEIMRPALSSIAQPQEEIGRIAINNLLSHIDKREKYKKEAFLLSPRLVKRDTT